MERSHEFTHLADSVANIANIVPFQKTGHRTHCSSYSFWSPYSKVPIIHVYGFKIKPVTDIILKIIRSQDDCRVQMDFKDTLVLLHLFS